MFCIVYRGVTKCLVLLLLEKRKEEGREERREASKIGGVRTVISFMFQNFLVLLEQI